MRTGRAVVASAMVLALASIAAAGTTSLLAVSRPSRPSARLTYSSSDGLAGLAKGPGTTGDVSARVFVDAGGSTAVFTIPTGTYANGGYTYRYGWVANDAARALFFNRDAPAGPTSVARTLFATGRRVRLLTKSLGDTNPLDLAAAPSGVVRVGYELTNGADKTHHCAQFLAGSCEYTPLDAGSGWRLRCRDGVADPSCGALPSCGNGVREALEECDGGPLCSPDCKQSVTSCCDFGGTCMSAPGFTLYSYLIQYCGIGPGIIPRSGLACSDTGACIDEPVDPTPVCCQTTADTCTDSVRSSLLDLYIARHDCAAVTGLDVTKTHFNAVCGPAGVCVPQ